jgi:hypothetical protein
MARKKYDMINEVLAHFDFNSVHQTMQALDWTWATTEGIPTIEQLKDSAEDHMNSAIEQVLSKKNKESHDVAWISASGGFRASAWKTKKGKLARVQLEFIVSEWDADNN